MRSLTAILAVLQGASVRLPLNTVLFRFGLTMLPRRTNSDSVSNKDEDTESRAAILAMPQGKRAVILALPMT